MPMCKKGPLKTVALAIKMKRLEKVKMKVPRITLRWAVLKVSNGFKYLVIAHWRWGMTLKINEWKTSSEVKNNNNNQHHKNLLEVFSSQYHRREFYWVTGYLKTTTKSSKNKKRLPTRALRSLWEKRCLKQLRLRWQRCLLNNWLQKCYWYYLYIWYCSSYGGDFDI